MAIKELTARERNECIGLAIDANLEMYHNYLDNMNISGDSSDLNFGAAILTVAGFLGDKGGYSDDYKEEYEGENIAPHMKWRWGRSVLFYDGFENKYKLETYHNKDRARKEMAK